MIDPRYEDPMYRGAETEGLSHREAFDLAKQYRIALRNKKLAMKMGDARVRRTRPFFVACWMVIFAVASIFGGIGLAVWIVEHFR